MRSTLRTALHLFGAPHTGARGGKLRVFPVVILLGNLFLCGAFQSMAEGQPVQYTLSLFFLLQSVLSGVLAFAALMGRPRTVLSASIPQPVAPWARVIFGVAQGVWSPPSLLLWASGCFFLLLTLRGGGMGAAMTAAFFLSLLVLAAAVGSCCLVLAGIRQGPGGGGGSAAILAAGLLVLLLTLSVMLQDTSVLVMTPGVSWAAAGVVAAEKGEWVHAGGAALLLAGLVVLELQVARRLM